MFDIKSCIICNKNIYKYYFYNNKVYCNFCITTYNIYKKKYCFYCKKLLTNKSDIYFIDDNSFCSRKCRKSYIYL